MTVAALYVLENGKNSKRKRRTMRDNHAAQFESLCYRDPLRS